MLKRIILLIILFAVGVSISAGFNIVRNKYSEQQKSSGEVKQKPAVPVETGKTALFVPYWSIEKTGDAYDRYFYFGVAPTTSGINTRDEGYAGLKEFTDTYDVSDSYLTVRMTNFEINGAVLNNSSAQKTIIRDAVKLAVDNGFAGIALDLEYSGLFDGSIPGKILTFSHLFSDAAKEGGLRYAFIVYGDVFSRGRPYEVKEISKHSDEIIIMAYDFHKSRGEPGPNFPLKGKETYGYDFEQMVQDFKSVVPAEKLTVTFGMYGYEWTVDEEKRPIKPAEALSINDIEQTYGQQCEKLNCLKRRDPLSGETEIEYVSENGDYHIIWYEDDISERRKQEYSKQQGIGSFVRWANGYF